MGRKLGRLISAVFMGFSATAGAACDWTVKKSVDPMTDKPQCMIQSVAAGIALSANGDGVTLLTPSAYHYSRDGLQVRIDEAPAIWIGDGRSTGNFKEGAREAVRQMMAGKRLRTSYRDYPSSFSGDAEICTLPALLQECGAPMDRIMDTRTQAQKIRDLTK